MCLDGRPAVAAVTRRPIARKDLRAVLPGDEAPDPIILAGHVHGPVRSCRNPIGDSEAVALKDRGDDFGERVRFALAAGPQIQRVAQRIVGVMRAQAPPAQPLRARVPTRGSDHAPQPVRDDVAGRQGRRDIAGFQPIDRRRCQVDAADDDVARLLARFLQDVGQLSCDSTMLGANGLKVGVRLDVSCKDIGGE